MPIIPKRKPDFEIYPFGFESRNGDKKAKCWQEKESWVCTLSINKENELVYAQQGRFKKNRDYRVLADNFGLCLLHKLTTFLKTKLD